MSHITTKQTQTIRCHNTKARDSYTKPGYEIYKLNTLHFQAFAALCWKKTNDGGTETK